MVVVMWSCGGGGLVMVRVVLFVGAGLVVVEVDGSGNVEWW